MIKLTEKELTRMLMALTTKVIGLMINSTEWAWSRGQMERSTKGSTEMGRRMAEVS